MELNISMQLTDEDFENAVEEFDSQLSYDQITPKDVLSYTIGVKLDIEDEQTKVLTQRLTDKQRFMIIQKFKQIYLQHMSKILDERLGDELDD